MKEMFRTARRKIAALAFGKSVQLPAIKASSNKS